MEDRRLEVLTQYDLNIINHYNARGALLLETDRGMKLMRSCTSGEQRLDFEDAIKSCIREQGGPRVDTVCRTIEGKLLSENSYGDKFCVRDWYLGEECSLKRENHCLLAVDTLNCLHTAMNHFVEEEKHQIYHKLTTKEQFIKRTNELKRVRSYIRDKKQKSEFEVFYLRLCDMYYEQAISAIEYIQEIPGERSLANQLCHGNYTYHSCLVTEPLTQEQESELFVVTSFEKACFGLQLTDFYYLLRKTMEKNDWSLNLGSVMIERFFERRKEEKEERSLLKALLLYPEKFWKITNYYYNNRKSWIPKKNIQKMFSNHDREPAKALFIHTLL